MKPFERLNWLIILSLPLISGCGGSSPTSSKSSNPSAPSTSNSDNELQNQASSMEAIKPLEVYLEGDSPKVNEIVATNVNDSNLTYDFAFFADQDETLTLTDVKPGTLLGCDISDIALKFGLHRTHTDGTIDISHYQGLGPAPVSVVKNEKYVVRVSLILDKNCLGLTYKFGIRINR